MSVKMSEFFNEDELKCPCCGRAPMHKDQLIAMDLLRSDLGVPLYPTSGFRCEKHNADVGGSEKSWHKLGLATDLTAGKLRVPQEIAQKARKYFNEVIPYPEKNMCHVGNPKSRDEILLDYMNQVEEILRKMKALI